MQPYLPSLLVAGIPGPRSFEGTFAAALPHSAGQLATKHQCAGRSLAPAHATAGPSCGVRPEQPDSHGGFGGGRQPHHAGPPPGAHAHGPSAGQGPHLRRPPQVCAHAQAHICPPSGARHELQVRLH